MRIIAGRVIAAARDVNEPVKRREDGDAPDSAATKTILANLIVTSTSHPIVQGCEIFRSRGSSGRKPAGIIRWLMMFESA